MAEQVRRPPALKWTDQHTATLRKLVRKSPAISGKELSKHLPFSPQTIQSWRERLNLPLNAQGRPLGGNPDIAARNVEIRKRRKEGATYAELSQAYSLSKGSLVSILYGDTDADGEV